MPPFSTPCPTMRHIQCFQVGASAWIAHSKLSNLRVLRNPPGEREGKIYKATARGAGIFLRRDQLRPCAHQGDGDLKQIPIGLIPSLRAKRSNPVL